MTLSAWMSSNFENIISGHNALFAKLKERGNIRSGGLGLYAIEPIMFPTTTGPQVQGIADPYATIEAQAMTGFTAAQYTWSEYALDLSIPEYDLDQQGSDTERANLLNSVRENGMLRFQEKMNSDLWQEEENTNGAGVRSQLASIRVFLNGGGSSTTDGSATPACLSEQSGTRAVASATSATPIFTVGNINRNAAGAAYWCTPILNAADTLTIQVLSKGYSLATRNADKPDLIFVHRNSFDKIMALSSLAGSNGGQFFSGSKMADIGFDSIRFRSADIVTDDAVPTVTYLNGDTTAYEYSIFYINTKYIKLRYLGANGMKPKVTQVDDPRHIKRWKCRWVGALTASNLGRVHCRHVDITN